MAKERPRADGTVVTWGDPGSGGHSQMVQHQLRDVEQIQGAEHAFAAIRSDGRVVTWGHGDFAPDESLEGQLQDVQLGPFSGRFWMVFGCF